MGLRKALQKRLHSIRKNHDDDDGKMKEPVASTSDESEGSVRSVVERIEVDLLRQKAGGEQQHYKKDLVAASFRKKKANNNKMNNKSKEAKKKDTEGDADEEEQRNDEEAGTFREGGDATKNKEDLGAAFQTAFFHYARVLDPELAAMDEQKAKEMSPMEDVAVALASTLLKHLRQLDPELAVADEAAEARGEMVQYDRLQSMQDWLRQAMAQATTTAEQSLKSAQESAQENATGMVLSCQQAAIGLVRLLDPELAVEYERAAADAKEQAKSWPDDEHQEEETTEEWLKRIMALTRSESSVVVESVMESVTSSTIGLMRQLDPELATEDEKASTT